MSLAVNLAMKLSEIGGPSAEGSCHRGRRRNHRAASPLQGRRAERHGPEVRRIDRRDDGPDPPSTDARGAPAPDRTAKSAITPCATATIRANTRSSSACWAKAARADGPRHQPRLLRPRRAGRRQVPERQAAGTLRTSATCSDCKPPCHGQVRRRLSLRRLRPRRRGTDRQRSLSALRDRHAGAGSAAHDARAAHPLQPGAGAVHRGR
jgi:hypothetical protein